MFEVLGQYIGNNYLRALVIFIGVFVILRVALYIARQITLKITRKTKTTLDDELIRRSSMPLTVISFLVALLIPLPELSLGEKINSFITNIIYSALVIVIAYLIYVITDLIIINGIRKAFLKVKKKADESIISLAHSIIRVIIIAIAILYILNLWGVEIGPLLAGLGIAGLAVALALQPLLSNIFSGASLVIDNTVRVGDMVYLDQNTRGIILKVGLRSTKIRTFDNELVIVPNTKLAESMIQNIAMPEPKTRVVVPFSVAYGSDVAKVKKIVLNEIKKVKGFVDDPAPIVRFLQMADSGLNFKVYFYVESFNLRADAIDEANTRIYNALNKAGIEIPFPQMDVHLKK